MVEVTWQARFATRERPSGFPIMHQNWRDLLFLHWAWDKEQIQKTLPPGLFVDTFEDKAYLSITPFCLERITVPNTFFPIPGFGNLVEVNFRTYVYDCNGTPGIWFYSLDLNSLIAAQIARKAFYLPYHNAHFELDKSSLEIHITGSRQTQPLVPMDFAYHLDTGESYQANPETLDFFLVERYVLFTFTANTLYLDTSIKKVMQGFIRNQCQPASLKAFIAGGMQDDKEQYQMIFFKKVYLYQDSQGTL